MVIDKGLNGDEQVVVDVPLALTVGAQVVVRAPGEGKEAAGMSGKQGKERKDKGNPESDKAQQADKANAVSGK